MRDTAPPASRSLLGALWNRLESPSTTFALLVSTVVVAALRQLPEFASIVSLERFLCVLSLGSAVAVAAAVTRGPVGWPREIDAWLARMGCVERFPFPFFDDELEDVAARQVRSSRDTRLPNLALGLVVLLVLVAGPAWILAGSMQPDDSGFVPLLPGEIVESYYLGDDDAAVRQNLDFRLTLNGVEEREEGRFVAHVTALALDTGNEADLVLEAGARQLIRGRYFSVFEVRPVDGVGGAQVTVERLDTGDTQTVELARGVRVPVGDDVTLELGGGTPNMGTMGPAIFLTERRGDEIVRRSWVYAGRDDFDARHGGGEVAIRLERLQPPIGAVLSVTSAAGFAWRGAGIAWLVALAVLLGFLAVRRRVVAVIGRSGDYEVVTFSLAGNGQAAAAAAAWLDAERKAELDELAKRLRQEDSA